MVNRTRINSAQLIFWGISSESIVKLYHPYPNSNTCLGVVSWFSGWHYLDIDSIHERVTWEIVTPNKPISTEAKVFLDTYNYSFTFSFTYIAWFRCMFILHILLEFNCRVGQRLIHIHWINTFFDCFIFNHTKIDVHLKLILFERTGYKYSKFYYSHWFCEDKIHQFL